MHQTRKDIDVILLYKEHSMDVIFFENEPFYPKMDIQGESGNTQYPFWKFESQTQPAVESNPPSLVKTNSPTVSPVVTSTISATNNEKELLI